jgi:hypothetical protein
VAETVRNLAAKGESSEPNSAAQCLRHGVEIGKLKQYYMYRELSQFVHGNPRILQRVREHVSVAEEGQPGFVQVRYRVEPKNWAMPDGCAGEAMMMAAEAVAQRAGRSVDMQTTMQPTWQVFVLSMGGLFPSTDIQA